MGDPLYVLGFFLVKLFNGMLFGVGFFKRVFLVFVNGVVFLIGGAAVLRNGGLNVQGVALDALDQEGLTRRGGHIASLKGYM